MRSFFLNLTNLVLVFSFFSRIQKITFLFFYFNLLFFRIRKFATSIIQFSKIYITQFIFNGGPKWT